MAYSKVLNIGGYVPPAPDKGSVQVGVMKVWSKNTKRTASTKMVGDIVTIKKTIVIEFPPLSPAEVKKVQSVVSNKALPFFPFEFCDGYEVINCTVYGGSPSRKLYSVVEGINYYTGYRVELVEK